MNRPISDADGNPRADCEQASSVDLERIGGAPPPVQPPSPSDAVLEVVQRMMQQVRLSGDFNVEFENADLVPCWQMKSCTHQSCPCHGKPAKRCWQTAGTYCGGVPQGAFARKLPRCEECAVYRQATRNPVSAVGEALDNTLHLVRLKHAGMVAAREAGEESERMKAAFLANMSHELRTPMNGMLGPIDLILDTELTPEQREFLEMARGCGHDLLRIVDDLFDHSRLEACRLKLQHAWFDVREPLEETILALGPLADSKGLEIIHTVSPDTPRRICGDPGRLRQVLWNLIGNAVKFTEKGRVSISVRPEDPQGAEMHSRRSLEFVVRDTGIGIDPEVQQRIFEAFRQADGSMTRRYGGLGLGLAITHQLVDLMGGRLWLDSTPGVGSAFFFSASFEAAPEEVAATLPTSTVGC